MVSSSHLIRRSGRTEVLNVLHMLSVSVTYCEGDDEQCTVRRQMCRKSALIQNNAFFNSRKTASTVLILSYKLLSSDFHCRFQLILVPLLGMTTIQI